MKKEIFENTAITIVKAGVAAIPFVGGSINSIWSDLQGKQLQEKIKRLVSITEAIQTDMATIETKVNANYTSSSDFTDIVESTLRHIIEERKDQKRTMFKNILLKCRIAKDVDFDKNEKFCNLLTNLGTMELLVLAVLYSPEAYNKNNGEPLKHLNPETPGSIRMTWITKTVHIIDVLIEILSEELHAKEGIIDALNILETNRIVIPQITTATLQTNGHPIAILKDRLTPKGKEFVSYLQSVQ